MRKVRKYWPHRPFCKAWKKVQYDYWMRLGFENPRVRANWNSFYCFKQLEYYRYYPL